MYESHGAHNGKGNERKGKIMMAERFDIKGKLNKARALAYRGEEEGGSEIVQVVIVLGFAVGLGAALMTLQNQINGSITGASTSINNMFKSVTAGAAIK